MATPQQITADQLRLLLSYDPATGVFKWRQDRSRTKSGSDAGRSQRGYVRIKVEGRSYFAHRLAWLYVCGVWPAGEIDHMNGDRADNRFANLRDVSKSENQQNKKAVAGASFHIGHGKWCASIKVDGKSKHLGFFDSEEEARGMYWNSKAILHPGYVA